MIQGPGLNSVLAVAAIVTLALSTPRFGAWVSTALLTLGASAYGETIRRISRGPTDGPEPGWSEILVPGSIPKLILCLTMAAGTVVPLWWWNADLHRSPPVRRNRQDGRGDDLGPPAGILMLIAFGRTEQGIPIGIRGCLKLCASHPFATALSLALVPISLILVEIGIALLVYLPGNLPFFALRLHADPEGSRHPGHLPRDPVLSVERLPGVSRLDLLSVLPRRTPPGLFVRRGDPGLVVALESGRPEW